MNVEPGRNTSPSITRMSANDLLHEIVAGLFDRLAQTKQARISANTPDENLNQTKPCSPRSP